MDCEKCGVDTTAHVSALCVYADGHWIPVTRLCSNCSVELNGVVFRWISGKPLKKDIGLYGDH